MTHLLHRAIHSRMPVAVGGKGIELFDAEGKAYIDASGGAAVSCLGHGHDADAYLRDPLTRLPTMNSKHDLAPRTPSQWKAPPAATAAASV